MPGYTGKIAVVDLTSGSINEELLPETIYRNFIGGVGLGVRILFERMKLNIEPLGPENMIGFVPGLLTGTPAPMTSKYMVVTKSPLTNTWGDSNSGGFFGPELKAAGYDAIFFTGTSPEPVYLFIHNGKAELKSATHLWGKDTRETVRILCHETNEKRLRISCIGPAGEALSLIASVVTDDQRVIGRSGIGAVMGSKKLKAIAVKGSGKVELADADMIKKLRKDTLAHFHKLDQIPFIKMISGAGTNGGLTGGVSGGNAPIKNWSLKGEEAFPDHAKIDGANLIKYQVRRAGCGNCPINCGGVLGIGKESSKVEMRKPEYETVAAFGTMLMNSDLESIVRANDICDRYGIDTISTGTVIAFAMDCYENGIISKEDTGGIELTWGSVPAILTMLEKVVRREGLGDILADGVERAAKKIGRGSEKYAIHIHGQEPGFHDPRFLPSRGLVYISDATPGRHMTASAATRLEGRGDLGPYSELKRPDEGDEYERRGRINAVALSYGQMFSSCGTCLFALSTGTMYPIVEFVNAVTGWDFTVPEAVTAGKRILTLRQAFNIREGIKAQDIYLPERIAKPALMGPTAGRLLDFEAMRSGYYKAMGWDMKSGAPSQQCLNELGLESLVRDHS